MLLQVTLNYVFYGMIFLYFVDFLILSRRSGLSSTFHYDLFSQEKTIHFKLAKAITSFMFMRIILEQITNNIYITFHKFRIFYFSRADKTLLYYILIIIIIDFTYWLTHFACHKYKALYWLHRPHHINKKYNLSIHFRDNFIGGIPFLTTRVLVCVLMGVDIRDTIALVLIHNAYMYFLHTSLPSWGWLEYLFISPSLHRIHHSIKNNGSRSNYGTFFSIWDLLFNTFIKEEKGKMEDQFGVKDYPDNSIAPIRESFAIKGNESAANYENKTNWFRLCVLFFFILISLEAKIEVNFYSINFRTWMYFWGAICLFITEFEIYKNKIIQVLSLIITISLILYFIFLYSERMVTIDISNPQSLMSLAIISVYFMIKLENQFGFKLRV